MRAGQGRPAAIAVLAAAVGLQFLDFSGTRLALFDQYERLKPRVRASAPVAIVEIDEASLAKYGQWPWPRNLTADLVRRIVADQPAALALDMLLPEADSLSPRNWAGREANLPADLRTALANLPDHDAAMAEAMHDAPVVLGMDLQPGEGTNQPGQLPLIRVIGGDPARFLPGPFWLQRDLPLLDEAAAGHGVISVKPDRDGVFRRLPLIQMAGGVLVPSLTTEMLRLATGARHLDVFVEHSGIRGLGLGQLRVPTQADGTVWVHYSPHDPDRFISAAAVMSGTVPAGTFGSRFVIIGVTGVGLRDLATTPLGQMPGSEIHAQLLENVFDGSLATRPRWALWAEMGLTLLTGAALIAALPRLGLRWYGPVGIVPPLLLLGLGFGAWAWQLWLLDMAMPAVDCLAVFIALLGGRLAEADLQRRRLHRELQNARVHAAHLAGELEAASRIQMGILPQTINLPVDDRFDLKALMEPAKTVGGDLYDFFMVDENRLFFAIGDVSGKGVPASLFMALGKSLYKSCVLRGEHDIAAITTAANDEISRDNSEMLFITLIACILDLNTGALAFCNAGHDAPLVVQPGEAPKSLPSDSGPPLCVIDGFPYGSNSYQMQPGEILCLTTDGVTEAMNEANELMGHARTIAPLATLSPGAGATEAMAAMRAGVADFVQLAEPSDDLTMVLLHWTGPKAA